MDDPVYPARGDRARHGLGIPCGNQPPASTARANFSTGAGEADNTKRIGTTLVATPLLHRMLEPFAASTRWHRVLVAILPQRPLFRLVGMFATAVSRPWPFATHGRSRTKDRSKLCVKVKGAMFWVTSFLGTSRC